MRAKGGAWAGRLVLAAVISMLVAHTPARASGDSAAGPTQWDIAFGAALTSDYISRGVSNSEHRAAVQPWAELDAGQFYAGYWGSNVSFAGVGYWENDLSVGVRPEFGPVSLDLGYVYYVYSSSDYADPSSEIYGKVTVNPIDPLTVGGAFYVDPANTAATYSELNAAYDFSHGISVSGALGFVTANADYGDYTTWNLGASWQPYDWVTLDARYHRGPDANRFLVSLSFQSSVKSLFHKN